MEGLPGDPVRRPGRRAGGRPYAGRSLTRSAPAGGRRILLLRHGRTADNAGGRIQGQLDTPLDETGRAQAEAVAPMVAAVRPAVVLSSDLARARDTAAAVAAAAGLEPRLDRRLRELDLGAWQGLTSEQARRRFPAEHRAWRAGVDVPRGGGETYREAGERATACLLEALPAVGPAGTLVAVTHGGTARGALCLLLDVDQEQWWRFAALGNACWTVVVEHPRGWRLERHGVGPDGCATPRPPAGPAREDGL